MLVNYQNRWMDKSYVDKIVNIQPLSRSIEQEIYQKQLNKTIDAFHNLFKTFENLIKALDAKKT